jgi:hypothetical protein
MNVRRLAAVDMHGTRDAKRRRIVRAELADVDIGREQRHYNVLQLWISVPLSLVQAFAVTRAEIWTQEARRGMRTWWCSARTRTPAFQGR